MIPAEARARSAGADVPIDMDKLKAETDNVGYPIIGLVHQMAPRAARPALRALGRDHAGHHGHRVVLQIRAALELVEADLRRSTTRSRSWRRSTATR